jgi:hypothetical protein
MHMGFLSLACAWQYVAAVEIHVIAVIAVKTDVVPLGLWLFLFIFS